MGELLQCRGAILSCLPSSTGSSGCGGRGSAGLSGASSTCNGVNFSARGGGSSGRGNFSCKSTGALQSRASAFWGPTVHLENSGDGDCGRISATLYGRSERKSASPGAVASYSGEVVCNAHSAVMEGILVGGDRFEFCQLTSKGNAAPTFSRDRRVRCHHSQFHGHFSSQNESLYEHGLNSHAQGRYNSSLIRRRTYLSKSRNVYYYAPSVPTKNRKHNFIVHSKPWWKDLLFQKLSDEDALYILGEADDDDENGEGADYPEDDPITFILDDQGNGIDFEDVDVDEVDDLISDDRKFDSWRKKRDVIDELRDFQETGRDPDSRDWEDWLDESWADKSQYMGGKDGGWYDEKSEWEKEGMPRSPPKKPERGMNRTIKELLVRIFENQEEVEEDLNFEEKVFRFTSQSTAKFVTILILVPWLVDFLVHDFVMVPFLRRWVEQVPLAAKVLDVKESQKLLMIERLKLERQRVRFESEIGKAPPLSDDELNEHIWEEALELREELREENRQAFANLWSDAVAGFTVFLLLVFNPQQVSIMKMTGDRLFTNISDTGKAFIIILGTDIFLGYHSESGWETVIEMLLDHYGLEASQASIYIFVAIVPVTIDACFKLWVFRYLTRLSPSAAATFREMKRH